MNDSLFPLLLILRYMHILGAIALMGGALFARFVVAPTLAEAADGAELHDRLRVRWSKVVMLASGLLLVSGLVNLGLAARYTFDPVLGLSYHMVVGIKFLLALPILFIAALLAGRTALARRLQAQGRFWMNVNLALALIMVLIGGVLKFTGRQLKTAAAPPAAASAR